MKYGSVCRNIVLYCVEVATEWEWERQQQRWKQHISQHLTLCFLRLPGMNFPPAFPQVMPSFSALSLSSPVYYPLSLSCTHSQTFISLKQHTALQRRNESRCFDWTKWKNTRCLRSTLSQWITSNPQLGKAKERLSLALITQSIETWLVNM